MSIVGNRKSKSVGTSYLNHPIAEFASSFKDVAFHMLNENSVDLYSQTRVALMRDDAVDALREFFINESCDKEHMDTVEYNSHIKNMEELFENDREGILESSALNAFNPVIGITFPLHKNILMNNVYENTAIPKSVAVAPKFTHTMETRVLITPEGQEIDIWKNQDMIKDAMNSVNPYTEVEVSLPEDGSTDIVTAMGGTSKDNLDVNTVISKITIKYKKTGDTDQATGTYTKSVNVRIVPGYNNSFNRTGVEKIIITKAELPVDSIETDDIKDTLFIAQLGNKFEISSIKGLITKVSLKGRRDGSNGLIQTCSVAWKEKTEIFEIPDAIALNTTISPQELKDVKALYNVDQLTKIMAMYKDVLGTHKDDTIRAFLDNSFEGLDVSQKVDSKFDFAPRVDYALDPITWRAATFFDHLDSIVTQLLTVLNDSNMTITVIGRPDIIRKVIPTEYSYTSPQNIGPVALEYSKTVFTSSNRIYQFASSQKLNKGSDPNDIHIYLKPRGSERIIYMLYDYQFYVSNEIRNAANHALPAIHAFDRYLPMQYQPVQGKIEIINPSGSRQYVDNIYPGGTGIPATPLVP